MYAMKWRWLQSCLIYMIHGVIKNHMVILNYGEHFPPKPVCVDCSRDS